jgi:acyl-CoA reductase-like NAD-dependent aldehyde dehydrogenase
MAAKPFLVNGEWRTGEGVLEVKNPYDQSLVGEVGLPTAQDLEDATVAAVEGFKETKNLPVHVRADALDHISKRLSETIDENAKVIAAEGGKPLKWATVEATRAVSTFRWASEYIRNEADTFMRLDAEGAMAGRAAIIRRFPVGPVFGISPFNFPLNLVAHKVAPSIAAGATLVLKPASATPLSALRLAEIFLETDLPPSMYSVLPAKASLAENAVKDPRFRKLTFTGSAPIGWYLKGLDPRKKVTLELGGNAGVIIHSDADLDWAAKRCAFGGYYQAGQSCISVQRILVQEEVYEDFLERYKKEVENLKTGDPMDPTVDVGPVIDPGELDRIETWVKEAAASGSEIVVGGERVGESCFAPTIIANTKASDKVRCEEIFGPVTTVVPYATFEQALEEVNDSRFGLQAGVFTKDIDRIMEAHRTLEVGGVVINDQSAFRADQQPYGGAKDSGFGREGLRWAIEEMTEPKILILSNVPL